MADSVKQRGRHSSEYLKIKGRLYLIQGFRFDSSLQCGLRFKFCVSAFGKLYTWLFFWLLTLLILKLKQCLYFCYRF